MTTRYSEIRAFVQHLAPTWRKTQHENFARVIAAFLERPSLVLSQLARAMPRPDQPLHGRLKRLDRFLDNPRLDEAALSIRWLRLAYRFGETRRSLLKSGQSCPSCWTPSTSSRSRCSLPPFPAAAGDCPSP